MQTRGHCLVSVTTMELNLEALNLVSVQLDQGFQEQRSD